MSATASFKAQAATQGCNWLFTDPYAYQYSEISGNAARSAHFESKASAPDTMPVELEGSPIASYPAELDAVDNSTSYTVASSTSRLKKSSSMIRSRFPNVREGLKYPHRRKYSPAQSELPEVVEHTHPGAKPAVHTYSSGLIPVEKLVAPPPYRGIKCPDASGLIPADENIVRPKAPASDFDSILKNIGPMSKKRRYCGPSRASRYYDRYSTDAG
ncbi:hypothetical protein F5X99DRAFT_396762 [Biscogniauxia marginata]|nr:hypothetical protein F5X99DRAFT_396762 [Biscogniauxia marginata]